MKIDKELIDKFRKLNNFMEEQYFNGIFSDSLKKELMGIGTFHIISDLSLGEENLMGVDGSYNSYGANYPHQLWVFRALAKGTKGGEYISHDILTPLDLEFRRKVEEFSKEKKISPYDGINFFIKGKLAQIELEVALKGIELISPSVIFMDGSLIRYKIECEEKWEQLKELCLEKGILIAGIIEEIGTKNLSKELMLGEYYDREIIFGLLNKGEIFTPNKQIKEGFVTTFIRPGEDPQPIAIDCLQEQRESIPRVITLAANLTPSKGRGIPIWLDVVDNEVRITNKIVEELAENYISPNFRYKLLRGKRKERWF